ncbi:MAG: carbon storage regulator [Clostridia bacterium]
MLMLSRKREEVIVIEVGEDKIFISPQKISSNPTQVHLGIRAPSHIKIWRGEIYDSVVENRTAIANGVPVADLPKKFNKEKKMSDFRW